MNINKDAAVTISYKVTSPQGKPLDAGDLAYLHGGYENMAHDAFQGLGGEVRKELGFGLFGGMMVGRSKGEGR
jgi:FKBP-type peptidyl-prolyl cis-trans isomerase SlyD